MLTAVTCHEPVAPVAVAPDIPVALSHFIQRLLAKDPNGRPKTAGVAAAELEAIQNSLTTPVPAIPNGLTTTPVQAIPMPAVVEANTPLGRIGSDLAAREAGVVGGLERAGHGVGLERHAVRRNRPRKQATGRSDQEAHPTS